MEKALLVTANLKSEKNSWDVEDSAAELRDLAKSTGIIAAKEIICQIEKPTPDLYIGKGKTAEIIGLCQDEKINVVIFNNELSPTHQRNLEKAINIKTIDRTQLILDIFARHAKSQEGKTQVELAQLQYLLPRLSGEGILLSRLGGGIGTRGPGEQKLEVDRRRIRQRISRLKKELGDLHKNRVVQRKKRVQAKIPQACLVGYTNAGKSTLLNALAGTEQIALDSLFTTLDTTSRALILENKQKVILSDTVGFLNKLPHHLIEAFKATLESVTEADLLLHVLDISDPLFREHAQAVGDALGELHSEEKPVITILNKTDRLVDIDWLERYKSEFPDSVAISALKKENLDALLSMIESKVGDEFVVVDLEIPINRMDLVDLIYREGKVNSIKYSEKTIKVSANLSASLLDKIQGVIVV